MVFQRDAKFLTVLFSSAMVVFFLPLLIFMVARLTNNNYDENQQNQNQYNNGQNQYYDNNNQQQQQQGCRWWQLGCSDNYQYQENGSRDERDNALPFWWFWAEDERRRDPEDMANPTLVVIYIWTVLVLLGILFYAYKTVKEMRDVLGLAVSMLMLANLSFISTLYIGGLEGGVEDDGRVIEEQGFYGQFGVLLYLTNLLATIFGVIWFFLIKGMVNDIHTTKVDITPSDYMKADYEAPSVKVNHNNMA